MKTTFYFFHFSRSSRSLLLLAFPDVPVLSCAAVGPAVDEVLVTVGVPGVLPVVRISAVAAILTAVNTPSAAGISNVAGVLLLLVSLLLLASLVVLALMMLLVFLLFLAYLLLLESLLLLAYVFILVSLFSWCL
jgi:hypothetical protein